MVQCFSRLDLDGKDAQHVLRTIYFLQKRNRRWGVLPVTSRRPDVAAI